jgi:hypothetical protein
MLADKQFLALIRVWARTTRVTNMHVERVLALVRRAATRSHGTQAIDAEGMAAAGMLGQWVAVHTKAGGNNPKVFGYLVSRTTSVVHSNLCWILGRVRFWICAFSAPSGTVCIRGYDT